MSNAHTESTDIRDAIRHAIEHFEHVLPGQAPIVDFVHHNTLHGFQQLPFPEALKAARGVTGNYGYEPIEKYREYYGRGRINRDDLAAVLAGEERLRAGEEFADELTRGDIYLTALTTPHDGLTGCQLNWQREELNAFETFQSDLPADTRAKLLKAGGGNEAAAVAGLWKGCLEALGLEHYLLHPEELMDLTPEKAETMLGEVLHEVEGHDSMSSLGHHMVRREAAADLEALIERVGSEITLRGLLQALTGVDVMEQLRPALIRHLANFLDQGMAGWYGEREAGFYQVWRRAAEDDPVALFKELPEWRELLEELPEDPMEAVVLELNRLELPEERWTAYLERLALELPGWSGMFLWRQLNPGYEGQPQPVSMIDYLAVRLVLERIHAQHLTAEVWRVAPSLDMIRWYFRRRRSELFVRYNLFNRRLPEYLASLAQRQLERAQTNPDDYEPWQQLSDMIWTWRQSPAADESEGHTVGRGAWPLFRLAQHLGLSGDQVRAFGEEKIAELFRILADLDDETAGFIWLRAYERHYREQIFNALRANHGRGRWSDREAMRPTAQVIFCMDEREEAIRRHLEEHSPSVETFGAAAHFNVFNFWRGMDDDKLSMLCPVVAVPNHEIREHADPGQETQLATHTSRRSLRLKIKEILLQESRRNLLSTALITAVAAPFAALTAAAKAFAPYTTGRTIERARARFEHEPLVTSIELSAEKAAENASPETPQHGFTDPELADRAETFLRNIGLTDGFSPLPVIMGHGSSSQNNPHLAAYDCGACSGRHSGPNARILAAAINRPEVRVLLAERGIVVPDDTWFLGAEHNTCDERIIWYDAEKVPEALQPPLHKLQMQLTHAAQWSAHERCRRLASAPDDPTPKRAAAHIAGRATDFTQARPELGHATNACAFIGRRSATQGAFFDRRMFLISYDPTRDAEGTILERLLLANGPVGAGINLEYYFSTVNNEGYGCGSKVTHNVTGLLGVMHGANDDLRTGLPKQMIEVHEAMRLLVVVEATTEMLTAIYLRQPPLQELIGNGWLVVAAKDPESDAIHLFDPARGWLPWESDEPKPSTVRRSPDWYRGHSAPLTPALVQQPEVRA